MVVTKLKEGNWLDISLSLNLEPKKDKKVTFYVFTVTAGFDSEEKTSQKKLKKSGQKESPFLI